MTGIALLSTGGTFSMGTDAASQALVPMYDVRHYALAIKILQSTFSDEEKAVFYQQLVAAHGKDARQLLQQLADTVTHNKQDSNDLINEAFQDVVTETPYFIDSIDFDFSEHYDGLKDSVINQLADNRDVIIIGGTDTCEFYAQAIARDPRCEEAQQKHSGKVIFISSMRPFDKSPEFIAKTMVSVLKFKDKYKIPGFYMLSAEDEKAEAFSVYDVAQPIVKISSVLPDAFRGFGWVGIVTSTGEWSLNRDYHAVVNPKRKEYSKRAVAPPFIYGNMPEAMLTYMQVFPNHDIIIEGECIDKDTEIAKAIITLVAERSKRGIQTYFVNDEKYHYKEQCFTPIIPSKQWDMSPFLQEVEEQGGITLSGTTTSAAYIDAMFGKYGGTRKRKEVPVISEQDITRNNAWGMRYIPDSIMFPKGVDRAAERASELIISALPSGVLPAYNLKGIQQGKERGVNTSVGFPYTGTKYLGGIVETATPNRYAAGHVVSKAVESLGKTRPETALHNANIRNVVQRALWCLRKI